MAQDFNEKFQSTRTGEELQVGYEEILKTLDPGSPEAEKLGWANQNSSPTYASICALFQPSNKGQPRWNKAEEHLLHDCASRGMPFDEIAEELRREFSVARNPSAVASRFGTLKVTRKTIIPWEKDQVDWLIAERQHCRGRQGKEHKTMAQLAMKFEQKFGFPRNVQNMYAKVLHLRREKLRE